jgi:hypothetical protein
MQRVRALLWFEEAFQQPLRVEDFHSEFWTIAETLFALRHVEKLLEPGETRSHRVGIDTH